MIDDISYCLNQARRRDYDRYVATLAAPAGQRGALSVLLAFNDEIARVRDIVSEPALGDIRFTWWREAVNEGALGQAKAHPVARALARTMRECEVDPHTLHAMIDARLRDLDNTPFTSLKEMETYAGETAGNLNLALLAVLGVKDLAALDAARQSGAAWALIGMLRALGHHRRAGRALIAPELKANDIVRRAEDLIIFARSLGRQIPRRAHAALMTNLLADHYIQRLKDADYDVERTDFELSKFKKARTILWHNILGRY
jgi:phytoene synthase